MFTNNNSNYSTLFHGHGPRIVILQRQVWQHFTHPIQLIVIFISVHSIGFSKYRTVPVRRSLLLLLFFSYCATTTCIHPVFRYSFFKILFISYVSHGRLSTAQIPLKEILFNFYMTYLSFTLLNRLKATFRKIIN